MPRSRLLLLVSVLVLARLAIVVPVPGKPRSTQPMDATLGNATIGPS